MTNMFKLREELAEIDDLIEAQVIAVSKKLELTQRVEELEREASELSRLISLRRHKHELMNGLEMSASSLR